MAYTAQNSASSTRQGWVPQLDLGLELKRPRSGVKAIPNRRKTACGIATFVPAWLPREADTAAAAKRAAKRAEGRSEHRFRARPYWARASYP